MAVMASDKTAGTRLMGEGGGLRVSCENIELGEAEEEVPVESYNGPSFRMGFNSRYLLEALEMVEGEKVRVELSGELDPGLIRPLDSDSPLAVIMPMRI
jgi:DNA polymerase-3 subunit beta